MDFRPLSAGDDKLGAAFSVCGLHLRLAQLANSSPRGCLLRVRLGSSGVYANSLLPRQAEIRERGRRVRFGQKRTSALRQCTY
jgi:hypothetical protein